MKKDIFIFPITSSPFSNNHFKLVEKFLTSSEEVVIFLLIDSNDKILSPIDKMKIIEGYFTKEELKKIHIIDSLITGDENVVSLVNEISLLTAQSDNDIHLVLDLKYSSLIAQKCSKTLNNSSANTKIEYYVHSKGQLFDVKNETLCSKEPLVPINVNELITYNINLNAFNYIIEHDLFFMNKIKTYINGHRLKHSISVANLSYKVAEANGLKGLYRYFICALLHDIGKHLDETIEKRIMYKHFNSYIDLPSFSYHQFTGKHLATKDFRINDEEVLDAIEYHCTGKPNMSLMGKIVYACDKIDPLRGYDSSDMIKAMMNNAESGFIYVLSENLKFLTNKTKLGLNQFDRLSKECFEFYLH